MTLPDVRCPKCHRLLMRGNFIGQIKCPKCKLIVRLPRRKKKHTLKAALMGR